MPVNVDPTQITPYTSTVPLLQLPPDAISGQTRPDPPLQGEFGKRGTGALAIGDSLLKGFMLGHQQKEQKKQAQAQATINAADAASEAAYNQYQDALTKAGGKHDDPGAQAAYQAYLTAFNAGKQAKAQFVIPEKTQKGKKGALTTDTDPAKSPDGKKKQASAGFNNIKDFFEANPHIVPQIALMTMQPKPPGLSPQGQEQVQSLETQKLENQERQQQVVAAKQKQDDLNFVALHQSLTPEQVAALPPDEQKQLAAAKFRLEQGGPAKAKFATWQSADGKQFLVLPDGEQPPPGYSPYEKTTAGTGLGSETWVLKRAAQLWGVPVGELTPADKNYLDSMAAYAKKRAQLTASASGSSTNVQGDRESWIRQQIGPPPPPPNGRTAIDAATFQQGIQPPPGGPQASSATPGAIGKPPAAKSAPTGQGGIGKPPQAGKTAAKTGITPPPGKETALTASVTRQAVKAQQEGYRKAETAYTKALEDADKAFAKAQVDSVRNGDPSILATATAARDRAIKRAELDLEDAKASVAQEYDAAVRSIGGTPGSQATADNPPEGASARVKDANGKLIGYAVNGQFVPLGQ